MASILNKIWSGADWWDKKENQQQRQQFAQQAAQPAPRPQPQNTGWNIGRVVHDVTHNPVTDSVGGAVQHVAKPVFNLPQTVNNDVFKPIQRDVLDPADNFANHYAIGRGAQTVALGAARSGVGTLQGLSGLYDLATPGTGTNRFSKSLADAGKAIDNTATAEGANPALYHGAQLGTDLLTLATPGMALKAASEVPRVGRALTLGEKAIAPVGRVADGLYDATRSGNIAQRTIGRAAQNVLNPQYQAANAAFTALQTGKEAAQGQDISPASVGTNVAIGGVGFPLAGAVGHEAIQPAINATRNVVLPEVATGLQKVIGGTRPHISYNTVPARNGGYRLRVTPEAAPQVIGDNLRVAGAGANRFLQDRGIGMSMKAVDENGNPVSALTGKSLNPAKAKDSLTIRTFDTHGNPTTQQISARPIKIADGINTHIHREARYGKDWTISESTTGMKIAEGRTQKEAIANAEKAITDHPDIQNIITKQQVRLGVKPEAPRPTQAAKSGVDPLAALKQEAKQQGANIEFVNRKPTKAEGVHGKYRQGKIQVFLKGTNGQPRSITDLTNTVQHEIGHHIDYTRRGIVAGPMGDSIKSYDGSLRPMADHDTYFRDSKLQEAQNIRQLVPRKDGAAMTQKEVYADAYRLYKTNPAALQKAAPRIFEELDSHVKTARRAPPAAQKIELPAHLQKHLYNQAHAEAKATPPTQGSKTPAVKPTDPLAALKQEALKYKSADEFVKAQGNPIYHGTDATFSEFNPALSNSSSGTGVGKGHLFFTDDTGVARSYGKNVVPASVSINKPLVVDAGGMPWDEINFRDSGYNQTINNIAKIAHKEGYDGLVVKNVRDTGNKLDKPGGFRTSTATVVFDKNQVKTHQQLTDLYNQAHAETLNKTPINRPPQAEAARIKMEAAFKEVNDQAAKNGTVDAKKWREANKLADEYWKTKDAIAGAEAKNPAARTASPEMPQLALKQGVPQTSVRTTSLPARTSQTSQMGSRIDQSQPFGLDNTTSQRLLPAPTGESPKLLQPGTIKLTPAQAKSRFRAINKRGGSFEVANPQRSSNVFTASAKGEVRQGANANGIKVQIRGSKDGVPVKVTPYNKPNMDFTKWNDKNALGLGRETMQRNIQRVAGKDAPAINKLLVESSRANETARTKFANDLRTSTKKIVVDGLGIKPGSKASASVQQYGEGMVTKEQLVKEVGEARAEQIVKASDYFRNQYDTLINDWNKVRSKYGFDPIPKRKDYFRHFQAIDQNAGILGTIKNARDLPTEISGITDIFNPTKPFSDAALQRKGNKTTYDAVGGFDNYINSVSRQIFHTDTVQKGRALEGAIRKAAAKDPSLELPNFVANLHEWTNLVSGKKTRIDRAAEELVGRKVYAAAEKIKQKTGANMIGANIGSALTNFVPFTQAAATTSKTALARGMADTASSPFTKNPSVIDGVESNFLTRRYPVENIVKTKMQKASDIASSPFHAVDTFTSRSIVAGKYFENRARGMDKQAAMKAADDYASRVITDRSVGQLPNLINTKTAGALTQFQAEVNNQVSFLIRDIPQFANGNKAKIASSVAQFVLYSYLVNEGYKHIMGRRVQFDPLHAAGTALNPNTSGAQKTDAFKQDILGGLPFTSLFTGGRLPVNQMFPNAGSIANGIGALAGGDKNKAAREIYAGVSGPIFYGLPPFGGGQAKKTIEDLMNAHKGYSETPAGNVRFPMSNSPADIARGVAFGQYATKQGQQYINRIPKPLNSTQSATFKGLDKSGQQQYYDVLQSLRKQGLPAIKKNLLTEYQKSGAVPQSSVVKPSKSANAALSPADKYQKALKDYNTKKSKMSDVQKYAAEQGLAKLKVQAPFPSDVISLYGMSKEKAYNFLKTNKNGQKLADQLLAYDKALYNAGLTSYLKFKTGIAPSKGSKGSRGGSRGGSKAKYDAAATVSFRAAMHKQPLKIVGALPAPTKATAPTFKIPALKTVYRKQAVNTRPKSSLTRAR